MKSSIRISNGGNTIRFTGAAANEAFKAMTAKPPENFRFKPMDIVFGDNLIHPRRLILKVNPNYPTSRYVIMSERSGGVGYQSESSLMTQEEWLEWIKTFQDELTGKQIREAFEATKAPFEEPKEWAAARKRYADTGDPFFK